MVTLLCARSDRALAPRPIGASRTDAAEWIVGPFLVWAAKDDRAKNDRSSAMPLEKRKHLATDRVVFSDIANIQEPLLHLANRTAVSIDNPDGDFGGTSIIRPIESDSSDRISLKAAF